MDRFQITSRTPIPIQVPNNPIDAARNGEFRYDHRGRDTFQLQRYYLSG
jgi:hypothetical protein